MLLFTAMIELFLPPTMTFFLCLIQAHRSQISSSQNDNANPSVTLLTLFVDCLIISPASDCLSSLRCKLILLTQWKLHPSLSLTYLLVIQQLHQLILIIIFAYLYNLTRKDESLSWSMEDANRKGGVCGEANWK